MDAVTPAALALIWPMSEFNESVAGFTVNCTPLTVKVPAVTVVEIPLVFRNPFNVKELRRYPTR